jgi:5-oxoprolinase (ATP-hydrolysing) subunit A
VSSARVLDFNCDLGEDCGDDAAILPYISSASIACGGHAGGRETMRTTLERCVGQGVAVGAHPSHLDREHFGRRELAIDDAALAALLREQVETLMELAAQQGVRLQHVKPHGALYNQSARDPRIAAVIAETVRAIDPRLYLIGLAGSASTAAARAIGLPVLEEVFAERRYQANGQLVPRGTPGAIVERVEDALAQVRSVVERRVVRALDGSELRLHGDTLCLHGDRPDAAAFARALHAGLVAAGVAIRAPGPRP